MKDRLASWRGALDLNGRSRTAGEGDRAAAYEAAYRGWVRRGAIAYCLLGAALALASVPLDHARFPERSSILLAIRVAGAVAFGVAALVLRSRYGAQHPRALALLGPLIAGALLQTLAAATGGGASPITVSTNFAILGIGLLIAWPPAWATLACALVIGTYVASIFVLYGGPLGWRFIDNVFVFSASSVIAVASSAFLERRRAREFADRWALAAASRDALEQGQRYRSVVDTAGSAILLVSPAGRIVEFNREAERMLGWSREEAIGQAYEELGVQRLLSSGGGEAVTSCVDEPTQGLEIRVVARDGGERTLVCNTSPLRDAGGKPLGVIVCAQDITDRKRAEDALRDSEARLRTVIGNAPVVLFTLDRSGMITFSDGRGLERLGLSPGELVGQHVAAATGDVTGDWEQYTDYFARTFAGEDVSWQGSVGEATFETRLTPMRDPSGAVIGVLGIAIDLTERKQAEDARLTLERKLLETQKLESLGLLAGGIAHDFNNLLMTVAGNVSVALADLPAGAPARKPLRQIEIAARRGSDLTRQMLAYAGRGTVTLEALDVNELVAEMRDLLRVSVARGARTTYQLASGLPSIEADPTQIRQVVMNLLTNASDAIGKGEGTITVRTWALDLDAETLAEMRAAPGAAPGPHVCIEVADTGSGMDDATLERIFDPFFSTKFAGRGLGLANVLGIVRAHRGALVVRSACGVGTTFRICLPCAAARAGSEESAVDETSHTPARTVLLVDDEEDVRIVTQHMLERLGCTVLLAGDGREGVDVFRAHAARIDAVIVDLSLPRLSGEQAFGEIRRIRPDARVILMSGYEDERTRRLAEGGLAGFLRKPFSVGDLRSTVEKVIGEAKSSAA